MEEEQKVENQNETLEQDNNDTIVEGYGYCATNKQRCIQDCAWGIGGKASVVDIN